MSARCLMVQGTGSGVGKSLMTAALCRIFTRRGLRVAPFKAQNMALNAAVTAGGGEIGRAQAAQAEAAGIEPTVDMNPILLKPEADDRSQVIVHGTPVGTMRFTEYQRRRPEMLDAVTLSLGRLREDFDLILMEGAGSPAEINLGDDLVNMTAARLAGARVLLVGDIDRGGVFAALFGTLALLAPEDRARVGGLLINRFRGDRAVLDPGIGALERMTGTPVLGVVPMLDARLVPAEDSLDLESQEDGGDARLEIAVVRLPRIANFDDLEPLAREPGVHVAFTRSPGRIREADLVVLPGSKSTIADLAWLRASGLAGAIAGAASGGVPVLGICGGFQMLGRVVRDPARAESDVPEAPGLGLLPVETTFARTKTTVRVRAAVVAEAGVLAGAHGLEVAGYEIHMGRTGIETTRRAFTVLERGGVPVRDGDGAISADGRVTGTYLHGVLGSAPMRRMLLTRLAGWRGVAAHTEWGSPYTAVERYDRLADAVEAAIDVAAVAKLAGF
jgi:adenosylcobyric acid synthase